MNALKETRDAPIAWFQVAIFMAVTFFVWGALVIWEMNPGPALLLALVVVGFFSAFIFFNRMLETEKKQLMARANKWFEKKKGFRESRKSDSEWTDLFREGEEVFSEMLKVQVFGEADQKVWSNAAARLETALKELELARISVLSGSSKADGVNISDLARLRKDGLISADEFDAFAEVFKKSAGEAVNETITAIEKLHEQYRAGAMGQGNYHASLWTLMDRLERDARK